MSKLRLPGILAASASLAVALVGCAKGSVNDLYAFPSTKPVQVQVSVRLVSGAGGGAIDSASGGAFNLRAFAADNQEVAVPLAPLGQTPSLSLPVQLTEPSLSFAAVAQVPAEMQPGPDGYTLYFQLGPTEVPNALVAADGTQLEALLGGVQAGTAPAANTVVLSLASTLAVQMLGAQSLPLSSAAQLAAYAQMTSLLDQRQATIENSIDLSTKVPLTTYASGVVAALQASLATDIGFQAQMAAAVGASVDASGQDGTLAGFASVLSSWSSASSTVFAAGQSGPAKIFGSAYVANMSAATAAAVPTASLAPSAIAFSDTDPGVTIGGTISLTPGPAAAGVATYALYLGGPDLAHSRMVKLGICARSLALAAGTSLPAGANTLWAFPIVAGSELKGGAKVAIANRVDRLGPPASLTARGGNNQATLSFASVAGATAYQLYRSVTLPIDPSSCQAVISVAGSPYIDVGLHNDIPYYYAVAALNGPAAGPMSKVVTVVPAEPLDPPEGLGVNAGDQQVVVNWQPNPQATGYNLYRSDAAQPDFTNATLLANVQSPYVDVQVTNGTTYHYALALVNHDTEGPRSGFHSALPYAMDGTPANLAVINSATGSATASWMAVPRAVKYNIYTGSSLPLTPNSAKQTTSALSLDTGITGNVCFYAVSATFADGDGPISEPALLDQRTVALSNNLPATFAIGQTNLNSTVYGPTGQILDGDAVGIARPFSGGLLLTDGSANRVWGFNSMPTAIGATADWVLGQASVTDINVASGSAANQFTRPRGLFADGKRLWVVDRRQAVPGFPPGTPDTPGQPGRVMGFAPPPTGNMAEATVVLGAPDFGWPEGNPPASRRVFVGAGHVTGGGGRLVICDTAGNRVLVYNQIPTYSNTPADLVLGQSDFSASTANPAGVTAASLASPTSAWTDGVRLLVYDSGNHRVLLWQSFPTQNGQPADLVIGQADKTHGGANAGDENVNGTGLAADEALFSLPGLSSNGTQIAVSDPGNNRVLIWNHFPTTDGKQADTVLGQSSLTVNAAAPPRPFSLLSPQAVFIDGTQVIVGDTGNQRYMVFDSQPP